MTGSLSGLQRVNLNHNIIYIHRYVHLTKNISEISTNYTSLLGLTNLKREPPVRSVATLPELASKILDSVTS